MMKKPNIDDKPSVIDNDRNTVSIVQYGREIRSWTYASDEVRRQKIKFAHEYIDGWLEGRTTGRTDLFLRSLHIRKELFRLFGNVEGLSRRELHAVVDRLVPKSLPKSEPEDDSTPTAEEQAIENEWIEKASKEQP